MSRTISAIFDAGVFRPLESVGLADGTPVQLHLDVASSPVAQPFNRESRMAWLDYLRRMESIPDNSPRDGLSNRDHDPVIYGGLRRT